MDVNIIRKLIVGPFQKGEDENIIRWYKKIDFVAQLSLLTFLLCDSGIISSFKIIGIICFTLFLINVLTKYIHLISFILNFFICSYWIKISETFHAFNAQSLIIMILCIVLMLIPFLHFIYDFRHSKKTIANDTLAIMGCLIIDGFLYSLDDLVINAKLENQVDKLILNLGGMICIFSIVLISCTFIWGCGKLYNKYFKKEDCAESKAIEVE